MRHNSPRRAHLAARRRVEPRASPSALPVLISGGMDRTRRVLPLWARRLARVPAPRPYLTAGPSAQERAPAATSGAFFLAGVPFTDASRAGRGNAPSTKPPVKYSNRREQQPARTATGGGGPCGAAGGQFACGGTCPNETSRATGRARRKRSYVPTAPGLGPPEAPDGVLGSLSQPCRDVHRGALPSHNLSAAALRLGYVAALDGPRRKSYLVRIPSRPPTRGSRQAPASVASPSAPLGRALFIGASFTL